MGPGARSEHKQEQGQSGVTVTELLTEQKRWKTAGREGKSLLER
jgi:hypothetical protein